MDVNQVQQMYYQFQMQNYIFYNIIYNNEVVNTAISIVAFVSGDNIP